MIALLSSVASILAIRVLSETTLRTKCVSLAVIVLGVLLASRPVAAA